MLGRWRRRRRVRREPAPPRGRAGVGVLRGPAHRERPPRHPPRVGPPLQGPLPPLPHDARQATSPARAAGTATACRSRSRSRRSSASRASTRSRTSASSAFNQRCRESVQRYVEDWSALTSRIGMWLDTADAYWTLTNEYIESVWWLFHQMWDEGRHLRGLQGRALLRSLRHRALEPRARPARRVPRRHRAVGLRALPGRRPRLRPPRVDDHAVDARRRTSAPRSAPTSSTCACATRGRPRPRARRGARRRRCSATTPRSSARSPVDELVGAALRARRSTALAARRRPTLRGSSPTTS